MSTSSGYVDLHLHTFHSDGALSPRSLLKAALARGLVAVAITDHDTISGLADGQKIADELGMEFIPGVEFSCVFNEYEDLHIVGLFLDYNSAELSERLASFQQTRDERAKKMVQALNDFNYKLGIKPISYHDIKRRTRGAVGRLHIARELVNKGIAANIPDAFQRYLIEFNEAKEFFPVQEAIELIDRLGGISILAHPIYYERSPERLWKLIADLSDLGIDGFEYYSNYQEPDLMDMLKDLKEALDLVISGGSDFHSPEDGRELGGLRIPYKVVRDLKKLLHEKRAT